MFKRKTNVSNQPASVDTLVIIGNGFDIWQGLYTDYRQFEKYYFANRNRILQKLGLTKNWSILQGDNIIDSFSDVEMIYGNPFHPSELGEDFWYTFEDSLHCLDAEQLNSFFGKEDDGLDDMDISIKNAQAILREAFCDWISTITVEGEESNFHFGENCLFVNFNYTDTLEKRFGVPHDNVFHIHGEASRKNSIVFGHSMHPQLPVEALYDFGGRFRGLYFVEKLLYETDKHTYIHYMELLIRLATRGIKLADIKHIYVLGHSFGAADLEYFEELGAVSFGKRTQNYSADFSSLDSLDAMHLMISYVILTYGNDGYHPEFDAEVARAFAQWVYQSQKDAIWKTIQKEYRRKFFSRRKYPHRLRNLDEVLSVPPDVSPIKWHITYHSEKDKQRIESAMRTIGVSQYKLYSTIDECLVPFEVARKQHATSK